MTIGEKIREIRTQRGLTQAEFADKIASSQTLVSLWEKGMCQPSLKNLRAISEEFKISVKDLTKCLR